MQTTGIRKFLAAVLLIASFFAGAVWENLNSTNNQALLPAPQIVNKTDNSAAKQVDFSLFWKVWQKVEEKYVDKDKIDYQKMLYGAIRGMVVSLGDPYTVFMDPQETKDFNLDLTGTFEGIGAELGIKDGTLTIITPLKDSPAEKAGLKAQDKILKIENTLSSELTIDEAVRMIRGPQGTKVKLTIVHKDENTPKEITITRATISVKSVELSFDKAIAWLKITRFDSDTAGLVNSAVDQIFANQSKGLILDLRNDPGGYLDSAIKIAGVFLPSGEVVVMEDSGNNNIVKHYASGNSRLAKMPMVILINEGTASAAEILAGALSDNRKIKLVGEKTFGKGSVQELIDLGNGNDSSLKVTVAHWLTPNGINISKEGIKPDVEVQLTKDDYNNNLDPQLEAAVKLLK